MRRYQLCGGVYFRDTPAEGDSCPVAFRTSLRVRIRSANVGVLHQQQDECRVPSVRNYRTRFAAAHVDHGATSDVGGLALRATPDVHDLAAPARDRCGHSLFGSNALLSCLGHRMTALCKTRAAPTPRFPGQEQTKPGTQQIWRRYALVREPYPSSSPTRSKLRTCRVHVSALDGTRPSR